MSLRDEAITHMGEAVYPKEAAGMVVATGSATLDALLDFLDAHTEEWEKASMPRMHMTSPTGAIALFSPGGLLAALRGTTEEGEGEETK